MNIQELETEVVMIKDDIAHIKLMLSAQNTGTFDHVEPMVDRLRESGEENHQKMLGMIFELTKTVNVLTNSIDPTLNEKIKKLQNIALKQVPKVIGEQVKAEMNTVTDTILMEVGRKMAGVVKHSNDSTKGIEQITTLQIKACCNDITTASREFLRGA